MVGAARHHGVLGGLALALAVALGCHPTPSAAPPTNSPATSPASPDDEPGADAGSPQGEYDAATCAAAREEEPCEGHGYCVLDWGEPGGWSEALWCEDGRWRLEQERNLEDSAQD